MKKITTFLIIFILPNILFAKSFREISTNIYNTYVSSTVNILIGLATLFFFYAIFKFVWVKANGADKEEAKGRLLWSVIALFIMFSFWGLIQITKESFDFNESFRYEKLDYIQYKPPKPGFGI